VRYASKWSRERKEKREGKDVRPGERMSDLDVGRRTLKFSPLNRPHPQQS